MIESCEVAVTCCDKFKMWIYFLLIILFSPFIILLRMVPYFFLLFIAKCSALSDWFHDCKDANCLWCFIKILLAPFLFLTLFLVFIISNLLGAASIIFVLPVYMYRNFKQFKIVMNFLSQ